MEVEVHVSRLEQPEARVKDAPKIKQTKELLDLDVEERETDLYRTLLVKCQGRHISSAQQTKADGRTLVDLGVSGYMSLEDLSRFELGIQIVKRKVGEWMALAQEGKEVLQ